MDINTSNFVESLSGFDSNGKRLYLRDDDMSTKFLAVTGNVVNDLLPASFNSVYRIGAGAAGRPTAKGTLYDPATETIAMTTGLRVQHTSPHASLQYKTSDFSDIVSSRLENLMKVRKGEIVGQSAEKIRDEEYKPTREYVEGWTPTENFKKELARTNMKLNKSIAEMRMYIREIKALGVKDEEVMRILQQSLFIRSKTLKNAVMASLISEDILPISVNVDGLVTIDEESQYDRFGNKQ
jgi:hypothetical protein